MSERLRAAYRDALGRSFEPTRPPQRIVSLVPSLTEALFAFGLGEQIAGVTRYCIEPADAVASKPRVGGTKNVAIAKLRSLEPDLVIANVEENTRQDIEALEHAGLSVFLTYARTVAQAIEELDTISAITHSADAARPILEGARTALTKALAANEGRQPVRVFCPIWRSPWMTIGPDTYIHDALRVCGAANVYADATDRYPQIDLTEIVARRPQIVLLPDEPYRFSEKHIPEVIERLPDARITLVDGKMLTWYGPRIPDSLRQLQEILRL